MITEAYQALSVIENFEAETPFGLDFMFGGEVIYEDITAPNTPLKEKQPDLHQIFYDAEYRGYRADIETSPSEYTQRIDAGATVAERDTIIIPDDDEAQQEVDARETAERSYVELRDVCSSMVWNADDSRDSLELSPAVRPGNAATESDGNSSSDPESDTAISGIPTIVNDAGNSHSLPTHEADIKQRMKDKIRFRRESQGVGDIDMKHLFDEPIQYDLTPEERAKEERRKQRNRVSAEKSRKKRIEKEKTVEQEYEEEEKKNTELAKEIRDLLVQRALLTKVWKSQTHSSRCPGNMFPQFDQRSRTCSASNSESELSPMNPAAPQSPLTSANTLKRSAPSDEAFCPNAKVPRMTNNNGQYPNTNIDISNAAASPGEFATTGSRSSVLNQRTSVATTPSQMSSTAFDTSTTDFFALQDALSMSTSYDSMTSLSNTPTPASFSGFPTTTESLSPAETSSSHQFTTSNISGSTCASRTSASLQMMSPLTGSVQQTDEQKAIEFIKQNLLADMKSYF